MANTPDDDGNTLASLPLDTTEKKNQPTHTHLDDNKLAQPKPESGEWHDERGRRTYVISAPAPEPPLFDRFLPGAYKQSRVIPVSGNRMDLAVLFIAGVSILFFGYDQGVMSFVNTSTQYKTIMGVNSSPQTNRDAAAIGGVVGVYYGGTLIGALAAGYLGDWYGRVRCIFIACLLATLGTSLQTSAQNITWMACARVVSGLGTGVLNVVTPILVSELSRHTQRGRALAIEFVVNITGVAVAFFLGFGLRYASNRSASFQWRFPLAFQLVFIFILIGCIFICPESPRWLVKVGRVEEARHVLARLRTEDANEDDLEVTNELYDICEIVQVEHDVRHLNTYKAMFFGAKGDHHHVRRRSWLSIWLQIMQELTGIGAVTVFAPTVFGQAGYSTYKGDLISGINDISYILSVLVAVYCLDRYGRRITLLSGAIVQGLCLVLAAIGANRVVHGPASQQYAWAAVVAFSVFAYTAAFGAGWLTVPWLYPTEIQPLFVRAKGSALSVFGWSIGNGVVIMITPFLFNAIGWGTFLLFAAFNFATLPFVYYWYPETMGRTLEEMDILFTSESLLVHNQEKELKAVAEADPELFHAMKIGDRRAVERKQSYAPRGRDVEAAHNEYSDNL